MVQHGGWAVQEDVTLADLVTRYFEPANRDVPESQQAMLERYCWSQLEPVGATAQHAQ